MTIDGRPVEFRQIRRAYLRQHPILCAIAAHSVIGALVNLVVPSTIEATSIGTFIPGLLEEVWAAVWLAGGLLLTAGLVTLRPRYEASGCALLGSIFVIDCIAITDVRGFPQGNITAGLFLAIGIGMIVRATLRVRTHPA